MTDTHDNCDVCAAVERLCNGPDALVRFWHAHPGALAPAEVGALARRWTRDLAERDKALASAKRAIAERDAVKRDWVLLKVALAPGIVFVSLVTWLLMWLVMRP